MVTAAIMAVSFGVTFLLASLSPVFGVISSILVGGFVSQMMRIPSKYSLRTSAQFTFGHIAGLVLGMSWSLHVSILNKQLVPWLIVAGIAYIIGALVNRKPMVNI